MTMDSDAVSNKSFDPEDFDLDTRLPEQPDSVKQMKQKILSRKHAETQDSDRTESPSADEDDFNPLPMFKYNTRTRKVALLPAHESAATDTLQEDAEDDENVEEIDASVLINREDNGMPSTIAWNSTRNMAKSGANMVDLGPFGHVALDKAEQKALLCAATETLLKDAQNHSQFFHQVLLRILKLGWQREEYCEELVQSIRELENTAAERVIGLERNQQAFEKVQQANKDLVTKKEEYKKGCLKYQRQISALNTRISQLEQADNNGHDWQSSYQELYDEKEKEIEGLSKALQEWKQKAERASQTPAATPAPQPKTAPPGFYYNELGHLKKGIPPVIDPEEFSTVPGQRFRGPGGEPSPGADSTRTGYGFANQNGANTLGDGAPGYGYNPTRYGSTPYNGFGSATGGYAPPSKASPPDVFKSERDSAKIVTFLIQAEDWVGSRPDKSPQALAQALMTRTEGTAHKKLMRKLQSGQLNSPEDVYAVIKEFEEPYEAEKAQAKFRSLVQGDKDFDTFFAEFEELLAVMGKTEDSAIHDLFEKMNARLQRAVTNVIPQPKTLNELASLCRQLEISHARMDAIKPKYTTDASRQQQVRRGGSRYASTDKPQSRRGTSANTQPKSSTQQKSSEKNPATKTCYDCGEEGHIAKDCPHKKNGKLNVISVHDDDIVDFSDGEYDSDEEVLELEGSEN
jgi:hypothetical protein